MQTSKSDNKLIALWLFVSLVAVIPALSFLPATLVGGEYIPAGNDSMYHARRIIDAAIGERGFYEFDTMIHAPEGSWVTWPWAYNYLMAQALKLALWIQPDMQPMKFLAHVPVFWLLVNVGLLTLVLRSLKVPIALSAVALLGFALSPLTQILHGVGIIEHHFLELTFVLLVTWSGLRLFEKPGSVSAALQLGIALGIAPAVHTSLFVLQIPVLLTVLVFWLQGRRAPFEKLHVTAIALLASTTLVLLPSEPFHQFFFELGSFSWFHFYVALCSAAALILLQRFAISKRNVAIVGGSLAVLGLPLIVPFLVGATYIAGDKVGLQGITEVNSPLSMMIQSGSLLEAARFYGYLLLLAPILIVGFLWLAVKDRSERNLFFAVSALLGLVMLMSQFRFHPFGSWALLAGGAFFAHRLGEARGLQPSVLAGGTLVALLLLMQPALRYQLFQPPMPGLDREYAVIHPIFIEFAEACATNPGVALSAQDDGHPIRYHTDCSVISNNFLLTERQIEKLIFADVMLQSEPSELLGYAPYLEYVLVHIYSIYTTTEDGPVPTPLDELKTLNPPLFYALAIEQNVPPNFELVAELRVEDERDIPYAQVYRISPPETDD